MKGNQAVLIIIAEPPSGTLRNVMGGKGRIRRRRRSHSICRLRLFPHNSLPLTRFAALRRLGINKHSAAKTAGSAHGPWWISNSPALCDALPNALVFDQLGLASLRWRPATQIRRTAVYGGVGGVEP